MKVKIVSTGTASTTLVVDAVTDELLENVTRLEIDPIGFDTGLVTATLTIIDLPVEIACEARVHHQQTLVYDPSDQQSIDRAIAILQAHKEQA